MKTLILSFVMTLASLNIATPAIAGSCDHSWQIASDGSICGDRAADRRPGGK